MRYTKSSANPYVMNSDSHQKARIKLNPRLLVLFLSLIGLLLIGSLILLPTITVYLLALVGIGIPLALLLWFRPELGIIGILFLTSSFIASEDILDIRLPIGGGLDFRDVFFLLVIGLMVARVLIKRLELHIWKSVGGSLILFMIMVVISTLYALIFRGVESNWVLSDFRSLMYYLLFFVSLWNIETRKQLDILLYGMYVIADISVIIIVLQQFSGAGNPILDAMTSSRDWRIYQQSGGVRIIPASHVLMHFIWIMSFGLLVFTKRSRKWKYFYIFQIVFIGVGHALTYVRSQWVAAAIGLGLMVYILEPKFRERVPKLIIIGFSLVLILTMTFGFIGFETITKSPMLEGIIDRFSSLLNPGEVAETDSLQWREFENQEAIKSIKKLPLFGVGLGGRYRELTTISGEAMGWMTRDRVDAGIVSRFTRYVHNSYLHITVKMGIPAIIMLLYFFGIFLDKGWKVYKELPNSELKGIVLGVWLSVIGFLAWSVYHTHLLKMESIPVVALALGIVGRIARSGGEWIKDEPKEDEGISLPK